MFVNCMKKIFILLILILLVFAPYVGALTLNGNVSYTVESARGITFENARTNVPSSMFLPYLQDENFAANKDYIKFGAQPLDRNIEVFKKGPLKIAYAVRYKSSKDYVYYYFKLDGSLLFTDIKQKNKKGNNEFPIKVYRYSPKGELIAGGIVVSENEMFLFDKNKKLITHRLNNIGYNDKGKKQWRAEEVKF